MTTNTTNNPSPTPPLTPQDQLLNELLDAQAAGDAQAVRLAWSKLDALGPAALTSAKRTQQALHDLRAMRMPVDLTDRVLARLDETPTRTLTHTPPPERSAVTVSTPRGRRRLPRPSGTLVASLLALATVAGLMVFARPTPSTLPNQSAQAHRASAPRLAQPMPDQSLPTPGVQDTAPTNPQRLTLGDTSRYDSVILTPITPWGTWNSTARSAWTSEITPKTWWQPSTTHPGAVAPFLTATTQDRTTLTPTQRAGQELMLLLEAQAKPSNAPRR